MRRDHHQGREQGCVGALSVAVERFTKRLRFKDPITDKGKAGHGIAKWKLAT